MRLRFFASSKEREQNLGRAFVTGALGRGVKAEVRELVATPDIKGCDAVAMVGVKSRRLFQACLAAGVVPIMLDKGYVRTRRPGERVWEFWRVAVGAHHPTAGLMDARMPADRFEQLGFEVKPWRSSGLQIVLAGSSAKYHEFYGLPDPTVWAQGVIDRLAELSNRPIVYRPKPSWDGAVPIPGTYFSGPKENINAVLRNAWAVVTHGSNACFEAALEGIPSIVLGDGVAAPISSRVIEEIADPRMAKRGPWLHNLAYRQFTEREMEAGLAWQHIEGWIHDYRTNPGL